MDIKTINRRGGGGGGGGGGESEIVDNKINQALIGHF